MESAGWIRLHEQTAERGGRTGGIRRDDAAEGPYRRLRDRFALTVIDGDGGDTGFFDSCGSPGIGIGFSQGAAQNSWSGGKAPRNPVMALAP
jgi:hypothetical protein